MPPIPIKREARLIFVAVALLALVFAATLGAVWHSHGNSSETNCSICHLNHQPIDHPLSYDRSPDFAPIGAQPAPRELIFAHGPEIQREPARAPPRV